MVEAQPNQGELSGLTIGVLVRVSTPNQVDNWSYQDQDTRLRDLIVTRGGTPVLYDENRGNAGKGASGRDLSKRDVALELLDDIAGGRLDGMAGWDAKRVTRDPFLADSGVIAKRLARRKALLVTMGHVYRLWQKDDLFRWNIEATIAGRDVLDIRDTFARGLFSRASREMFFQGVPPVGYRHRIIEERRGAVVKVRRLPEKDPDAAPFMVDLVDALQECQTAGQVVRRLNGKWADWLVARVNRARKSPGWRPRNITIILGNPVYHGIWEYGRNVRYADGRKLEPRSGAIWDTDRRRERASEFSHQDADLAYWTAAQARAWLRKFQPRVTAGVPQIRARKHEHPLLGVLACPSCGRRLVGSGRVGYICPGGDGGHCPQPCHVTDPPALRILRGLYPDAIRKATSLLERGATINARANEAGELDRQRKRLAALDERLEQMTADLYGDRAMSESERRLLRQRKGEIGAEADALRDEVDRIERRSEDQEAADATLQLLAKQPEMLLDRMAPAKQAALYRRLFENVQIVGTGKGVGRKHAVVHWDLNSEIANQNPVNWGAYLGIGEMMGGRHHTS